MFAGLSLRDAAANQDATVSPRLQIRVGINLGPVRLVKDINGQPNIIGDGINVAQRVMNFAEPGQILVSRSYFDVMVRLSEDYAQLFHYEGAKTDKHVREHEVYAISTAPSGIRRPVPVPAKQPRRLPSFTVPRLRPPDFRIPRASLRRLAAKLSVNPRLLVAAPIAFVLIVSSGVIARSVRTPAVEEKAGVPKVAVPEAKLTTAEPAPAAEPSAAGADKDSQVSPKAEAAPPPARSPRRSAKKTHSAEAVAVAKTPDLVGPDRTKAPPATARTREGADIPAAPRESEAPASPRGQDATINVVALPWAEVYVDGAKLGVSPPLRSIPVRPGKHKIELRNSSFPAHVEMIEAKAGTEISIRHRFLR
jgi:hypothetical protein